MKTRIALAIGSLIVHCASLAAGEVARATLDNGLEVLVEERRGAPTVACRVYVKTGSIYEARFLGCGISHIYEHLLAGGTTSTRPETETAKILQSIGGNTNAYTTYDVTCYHITTTGEHYGTALDLLADWMTNNVLDEREVAREREVVKRELEKDLDEPSHVIWQLYAETAYRVHPVRLPIIGFKENIERLGRDDLVAFYRDRYVPNNALVVVVGDVDKDEALDRVRGAFASWERRPLPPFPLPEEPRQIAPRRAEKAMGINVALAKIGWPTVDLAHQDLFALDVLAFVLAQGEASRLTRTLVHEKRLANAVSASSWTPSFAPGQFAIQLEVEDHAKLEEAIAAALAEVERVREAPVGEDELARAKRQKLAEHVFNTQSNEDRAEDLASWWIGTGDPFFGEKYVAGIARQTPADLVRVARQYFVPERLNVAVVRPEGEGGGARPSPGPGANASASARTTAVAAVRKTVLENGLTLLVKRLPGTASVSIQAMFRGGVRAETPETSGLFGVLANTMVRGTKTRSPEDLSAAIEGLGATLEAEAGWAAFGVRGRFLAQDVERGVGLVREVLLDPSLPEPEIERQKWEAKYRIAAIEDDWAEEGTYFLREKMFPAHPYGLRPAGRVESVEKIDRAALVAAHARFVVPERGVIALFGDVEPERAEALLRQAFATWTRAREEAPPFVPPPPPAPLEKAGEVVKEVAKGQTTIALGYTGLAVESGDRYALEVIDAITSGIGLPSGWLHEALRGGDRSLVYFVHALDWMAIDGGLYYILTRCNPEDEATVVGLIRDVQRRIQEAPVSDEDLARGKSIAITAAEVGYETPAQQAQAAIAAELNGLGADFLEPGRYAARIEAVTKEDVLRVARKVFGRPSLLALVRPAKEKEPR